MSPTAPATYSHQYQKRVQFKYMKNKTAMLVIFGFFVLGFAIMYIFYNFSIDALDM